MSVSDDADRIIADARRRIIADAEAAAEAGSIPLEAIQLLADVPGASDEPDA